MLRRGIMGLVGSAVLLGAVLAHVPAGASPGRPPTSGVDVDAVTYRGGDYEGFARPNLDGGFVYERADLGYRAECAPGDEDLLHYENRILGPLVPESSLAVLTKARCDATGIPAAARCASSVVWGHLKFVDVDEPAPRPERDRHEIYFTCQEDGMTNGLGDPRNFIEDSGALRSGDIDVLPASGPPPPTGDAPTASISSPSKGQSTGGPVPVSGQATDDAGIQSVVIGIQDRTTGKWWRANGTWGSWQAHGASLASPGAASTAWSFVWDPPPGPGSYGVAVVARDTSGQQQPRPRPYGASR